MTADLPSADDVAAMKVWARDMAVETPGRAWFHAPYMHGRSSIAAALKVDRADPLAAYATLPFRILNIDDQNWIAGAIGCPPAVSGKISVWCHLDISDVVLWNPRTGALRVAGEPANAPCLIGVGTAGASQAEVVVYDSGYAFFRAWVERRANFLAGFLAARESRTSVIPTEPACGNVPGLLAIGKLDALPWFDVGAAVLKTDGGIDPGKLKSAIFRAARLPRVATNMGIAA